MSVAVCSPVIEVEEVELSPSNVQSCFRERKVAEDEAAGKLQLELLERVEDILEKIGRILSRNFHKLPTKVQELSSSTGPGDLLQRLNLLTRDRVLEDFLQENPPCRQLFSELFYCRYPYFKEQESSRLRPLTTNLTSKDALLECIDAYDGFDPLYSDSVATFSITDPISLHELELVEKMYSHIDTLLSKELVDESVQGVLNMAPHPKTDFSERFAKFSNLSEKFQKEFQKKIFSQLPAKSGIELEMTIERYDQGASADEDRIGSENTNFESEASQDLNKRSGTSTTTADSQLQPYKGWHIEGPRVQLARAKNFLADCDVDRTADWARKVAELSEYFAYLQSQLQGEDWIHDLEDALDMLRAHCIFENYHYGNPQLIVDFPTDIWPTQSKRLPPIPGPEIILCPKRRDLTAPRRLLHVDVASAYDQQYGLPADVLRRHYLEPYWKDSEEFWVAGPFPDTPEPGNLAACENEAYEECMDGSMAQTVKFLEGKGSFRPLQRSTGSHDGALKVKGETLEAFARFRGGKRAALQQCLGIFNHDENRKMCTLLSIVALPEPVGERKNEKADAGIVFTTKKLANPPEKESRDPWAYTRSYQQFRNEELRWAHLVKGQSIEKSSSLLFAGNNEIAIDIPKNWKGPVMSDPMNPSMMKTYEHFRRCQKIHQGLKRAAKRAPRDFIIRLLNAVEAGLVGAESVTQEMNLKFGEHEYESPGGGTFANIRPTEAAWLEYICQPSRNRPYMLEKSLGRRGELMLSRVAHMMDDISPISLFRDTKPRTMKDFLKELNVGCRGPVKRYRFTENDVKLLAPKLHELKILRLYTNVLNGEWMFGRPETEFHPEDLVKWPNHEPQEQQSQSLDDDFSEQDFVIPPSSEDFYEYPKGMPKREDVISLRDFINDPVRSSEWLRRTANFFHCLGFRLGKTLKTLQRRHEENQERTIDSETQEDNDSILRAIITRWEDDTEKLPNDPLNRPAKKNSSWRMTMTYHDVIKTADPDTYEKHQSAWADVWSQDGHPAWKEASEIVRKNLIREAYENKTMLWPLALPYNSYTANYQVADPTTWRERLSRCWKGEQSTEAHEARVDALDIHIQKEKENAKKERGTTTAQKQNPKPTRREPVWTFGHPSRKKAVHLFWDINNWPVHLQSESRRQIIASRGPKKQEHRDVDDAANDEATAACVEKLEIKEDEMPYWRKAEQRRKFVPGRDEFWMGDTPLQKRVFEKRMKRRLAPPGSKKHTWRDTLKTAVLGSPEKRKSEAISDDLPSLPANQIPQSRPAKRRHTRTFLRKMGKDEEERDLFAIARGEKGIRETPGTVPICTARRMALEEGEVTYYIPETRIWEVDMMEIDEPRIELGLPMKK
ncbi:hypothetical protein M441DRAFT_447892 [Trichoderma asperellum CBS 433.97]|uniref:Uncharacterized protein n=1 Tax=Trichoderma asperellum (strain ATCC 204424 / CBS 433.97 / NBRC 101777) TaxID=1042311 RepID=A0A2T3YZ38_TRIA4|nr:hypothetical protein M441DRAFT_447892 [Trichoderma asperellum CBS 433.97]PTB37813.1 hypothetical protein M441DRAFT_447892 [Trichoderma asperellum CBS 433.97]